MPTTNPFTLEYLIGGLQTFTTMLLLASQLTDQSFLIQLQSNNIIALLSLLAFAYPLGIVLDNLAAYCLSLRYSDNSHRHSFNSILAQSMNHVMDRVLEFQRSKRIVRITLANLVFLEVTLLLLLVLQKLDFIRINIGLAIVVIIVGVAVVWTYFYISSNYEKFLHEMNEFLPFPPNPSSTH